MDKDLVLDALLKKARPEILKEYRVDSCIASTVIGIDVLTCFGILSEPLAVRTSLFNKPYADRINAGADFPQGIEEVKRWGDEDGSYAVGIGFGGDNEPNKWAGHLVILAEKSMLIDLSIDQASRPQYNMTFNPFCITVDQGFLSGRPKVFGRPDGCVIRMEPLRNNYGYLTSPDWVFSARHKKIVENIIREIRSELK